MTNVCVDAVFRTIADPIIPKTLNPQMPKAQREAKKVLSQVGLEYKVIDCCPCEKFIYYTEANKKLLRCPKCQHPQYRSDVKKKRVPHKKMHYFSTRSMLASPLPEPFFVYIDD